MQARNGALIPDTAHWLRLMSIVAFQLDMRKRFRGLDPGTQKQHAGEANKTDVLG